MRSPSCLYIGGVLKFVILIALLAAAIYHVVRVVQRGSLRPAPRRPRPDPPRVIGPDDDPDFLRDLDRKRKRKHPEDPETPPV
jgi:hypothetical protein